MQANQPETPGRTDHKTAGKFTLDNAIRDYVRTHAVWHGRPQAAQHFGVSRHTLYRCLERGRLRKSLPKAVVKAFGDDPDAIAAVAWAMTASPQIRRRATIWKQPSAETLEDALWLPRSSPVLTFTH